MVIEEKKPAFIHAVQQVAYKVAAAEPSRMSSTHRPVMLKEATVSEASWLDELIPKVPQGPTAEDLWAAELIPKKFVRSPAVEWMDELTPVAAKRVTKAVVLETEKLKAQMSPSPMPFHRITPSFVQTQQRSVVPQPPPATSSHVPPIHKAYQEIGRAHV